MEPFYSLMFSFGLSNLLQDINMFDIVGNVPEEIGIMILRMLDSRTLLSAAMVNKKWRNLCRTDTILRSRIRQQIIQERAECLIPFKVSVHRNNQNSSRPFATLNGCHRMTVIPATNIVRPAPTQVRPQVRHFGILPAAQPQKVGQKRKLPKIKSSSKTSKLSLTRLMRL